MLYILQGEIKMETLSVIILWVMLVIFIGIIISMACGYESQLKDAETKAQAEEIANKLKICLKDMEIKRLEDEINKLKKRKKSK